MNAIRVADLPAILGVTPPYLRALARSAPELYEPRTYRDGNSEPRELLVPSAALKEVQRRIHERILRSLPVHPCVHSARGRSIISNAEQHVGHPYLSRFDIRHAFPSVGPHRVRAALERAGFARDVANLLMCLTTVEHELPQGAPTSPALLNAVLVDFDRKIVAVARGSGLSYSRYVDDLYLSGGARTVNLARTVEKIARAHQLTLHPGKRFDWGPRERHSVTNIVVNTTPSPLPEYTESVERTIARHRCGAEVLNAKQIEQLLGKIAFVTSVNADIGERLAGLLVADDAAITT